MKLRTIHHARRSKAPLASSLVGKSIIILSVLVMAFIAPLQPAQKAFADQYDDQINALQAQSDQYAAQAAILNSQAVTLQSTLAELANEQASLQNQIDLNTVQYSQLTAQIADTKQKIQDAQDALGQTIADIYVNSKTTPLEMIASSKNIGDYLDKQTYRNSVSDQLNTSIKNIQTLKASLDKQQSDLQSVLDQENTAKASLVAKENEQQSILNQTQNNEAAYQGLIASNASKIAAARATQAALNSRGTSTGGALLIQGGLRSDYITSPSYGSWTDSNCPIVYTYESSGGVDGNGSDGRGYGCRQCASYVAWKINQVKGYWPSWGNAYDFQFHGTADSSPHAGDIAILTSAGEPGHVAWVETDPYISTSGPLKGKAVINVSQYNYNYGQGYGMYSVMQLSVNFFNVYRIP